MSPENRIHSLAGTFGTVESFRLCTEGLQALERYERQPAEKGNLKKAEERFQECVAKYPDEMLPKFYLGSVKTLRGYTGLDEAVPLLQSVVEQGTPDLQFAAQFNLAAAYIEKYEPRAFDKAENLLLNLVDKASSQDAEDQRLLWWSRAILLYIYAERIWKTRENEVKPDPSTVSDLIRKFDAFKEQLDESPFRQDAAILAEYWNAFGTLTEARAFFEPARNKEFGEEAKEAFSRALSYRPGWMGYRQNLARVYGDVFKDYDTAFRIWNELLEIRPDGHYIHYNLGKLYYQLELRDLARGHLKKAVISWLPEAQALLEKMGQEDSEILKDPDIAIKRLKELLKMHPDGHYIHYSLGKLHYHHEQLDLAREHLKEAVPEIPQAQELLDKLDREDTTQYGESLSQ